MEEVCIKCGNPEGNNPSSKLNMIGKFSICRSCGKQYFNMLDKCCRFCQKFYGELERISIIHPERLNPETPKGDAIV